MDWIEGWMSALRDVAGVGAMLGTLALARGALRRIYPTLPYARIDDALFGLGEGGAFRERPEGKTPAWVEAAQRQVPLRSALQGMSMVVWSAALFWAFAPTALSLRREGGSGFPAFGTVVMLWLVNGLLLSPPATRGATETVWNNEGALFSPGARRLKNAVLGTMFALVATVFALTRWRGEPAALLGQWAALGGLYAILSGAAVWLARRLGLSSTRAVALRQRVSAAFERAGFGAVDVRVGEVPDGVAGSTPDGALLVDAVFAAEARDDELDALARQLGPVTVATRGAKRRGIAAFVGFFAALVLLAHAEVWPSGWCSLVGAVAMVAAGVVLVTSMRAVTRAQPKTLQEGVAGEVWARAVLRHAAWHQRPLVAAPGAGGANLYDGLEAVGAKPPFARPEAPEQPVAEGMLAGVVVVVAWVGILAAGGWGR